MPMYCHVLNRSKHIINSEVAWQMIIKRHNTTFSIFKKIRSLNNQQITSKLSANSNGKCKEIILTAVCMFWASQSCHLALKYTYACIITYNYFFGNMKIFNFQCLFLVGACFDGQNVCRFLGISLICWIMFHSICFEI